MEFTLELLFKDLNISKNNNIDAQNYIVINLNFLYNNSS
jgi:hypothetical protein